ncbi:heterokaryon incompatibility protein-domain-containing protein [Xylariaceae sp. FL0804]|nr:heterokaryon incompatibility protein-domain-containing protein [Xylariaceae sp. FL0804]
MTGFTYTPLSHPDDTRLVVILPGSFEDPIRVKIAHVQVRSTETQQSEDVNAALGQAREMLPEGWNAHATMEGRALFVGPNGECTYTHPQSGLEFSQATPVSDHGVQVLNGYDSIPESYHLEPLSYCCGPPTLETVYVETKPRTLENGQTDEGPHQLPVRSNLFACLKELRYPDRERAMWIDALSINQNDIEERNAQVPRMRYFYAMASRVVMWIGPAAPCSAKAFDTLVHLGRQVVVTLEGGLLPRPGASEPTWHRRETPLPYSPATWDALATLLSTPWFSRLWVVQECQMAPSASVLRYGRHELAWPLFRQAMVCLFYKQNGFPAHMRHLGYRILDSLLYARDGTFLEILWSHHRKGCADPRDRVYGLMSMAPPGVAREIRVDYGKPKMHAYRDAVLACLKITGRLDMLRFCGRGPGRGAGRPSEPEPEPEPVPSWVPDLDGEDPCIGHVFAYFASGYSASHATLASDAELRVAGVRVASVSQADEIEASSFGDFVRWLHTRVDVARLDAEPYPPGTGESVLDGYLETLASGQLQERYPRSGPPPFATYKEQVTSASGTLGLRRVGEGNGLSDRFKTDLTFRLRDSVAFVTDQGYVGCARVRVLPGDTVAIVLGCSTPMVLRPVLVERDKYEIIGECYVHGLMEGEALLGPVRRPWKLVGERRSGSVHAYTPAFVNVETGEHSMVDPRMGPLPDEWQPCEWKRTREDPRVFYKFKNKKTGEILNSDPRLSPGKLKESGVIVEDLILV